MCALNISTGRFNHNLEYVYIIYISSFSPLIIEVQLLSIFYTFQLKFEFSHVLGKNYLYSIYMLCSVQVLDMIIYTIYKYYMGLDCPVTRWLSFSVLPVHVTFAKCYIENAWVVYWSKAISLFRACMVSTTILVNDVHRMKMLLIFKTIFGFSAEMEIWKYFMIKF